MMATQNIESITTISQHRCQTLIHINIITTTIIIIIIIIGTMEPITAVSMMTLLGIRCYLVMFIYRKMRNKITKCRYTTNRCQ